jgi:cytochrome b561
VRGQYIVLHKSFGITVLILGLLFVLWRSLNKKPKPPLFQSHWQYIAAITVHHLLLTLMVLIPIFGYLMVCAAGRTISFFGLFNLPNLITENKALGDVFFQTHETLAYLFIVLIGIHIAAALYHHFILKDNILKKMLPFKFKD